MARNFYYGADARVVQGSARFAELVGENYAAYGISAERAAQYVQLDAALQEAYLASITPNTRTPVNVRRKDEALRAVQREAVALAQICYANGVEDPQLLSLGLQPRRRRSTPAAPVMPPVVRVEKVEGRRVTLVIDSTVEDGPGRLPDGCMGAQLWSHVGEEPAQAANDYRYEGIKMRRRTTLVFPNDVRSGATVYVCAAWISRRGKSGVSCQPVRFTIQGGPVLVAA